MEHLVGGQVTEGVLLGEGQQRLPRDLGPEFGQDQDPHPPIGGIGLTFDQVPGLQLVDQAGQVGGLAVERLGQAAQRQLMVDIGAERNNSNCASDSPYPSPMVRTVCFTEPARRTTSTARRSSSSVGELDAPSIGM